MNRPSLPYAAAILLLFGPFCTPGCSGGSSPSTSTLPTNCASAPATPANLVSSSVTSNSVTLSWTAVAAPTNCTVTYTVYNNATAAGSGLFGTSATFAGLSGPTTYTFTVAAVDSAGASSPSNAVTVSISSSGSGNGGTTANGITLTGKLIWHSYTTYGFSGVQSWMANFDTGNVYQITPANVSGAMNYAFNQNGSEVVFMGSDNSYSNQAWDIWVASVTSTGLANITKITSGSTDGSRNEDPKFSSDGTEIIFKKNLNDIYSINTSSFTVSGVAQTPAETLLLSPNHEIGMPFYLVSSDTNYVYTDYANGTSASTINFYNNGAVSTLYTPPSGEHAYYPIALNSTQFYFAQSDAAGHDQVNLGDTSGNAAVAAAFDKSSYEFADPWPMNSTWVAYTSTQPGGAGSGNYNIWIGNFSTGATYVLDSWISGSNQTNSNLGSTFYGTVSAP